MARNVATLVETIRQGLEESGATFHVASWCEADGDACYLIHRDGRMVGMGDYQYGFGHIDELGKTYEDKEVARWARSEAGRIAGDMEEMDLDDDEWGIMERLPAGFGVDAELAENALASGAVSVEGLFDLLTTTIFPVPMPTSGQGNYDITLTQNLTISRLEECPDGTLRWADQVALNAGDTVKGYLNHDNTARISAGGGAVSIPAEQFTAQHAARPHCNH